MRRKNPEKIYQEQSLLWRAKVSPPRCLLNEVIPEPIKREIVSYLDDEDLRSLSIASKEWKERAKTAPNYGKKLIYYIYDHHYSMRTATIDIGSKTTTNTPVFVPLPSLSLHIDRHSKPSRKEFIHAFISACKDTSIELKEKKEYCSFGTALFKIKLKNDAPLEEIKKSRECKLADIEEIIYGDIIWSKKHHHLEFNEKIDEIKEVVEHFQLKNTRPSNS